MNLKNRISSDHSKGFDLGGESKRTIYNENIIKTADGLPVIDTLKNLVDIIRNEKINCLAFDKDGIIYTSSLNAIAFKVNGANILKSVIQRKVSSDSIIEMRYDKDLVVECLLEPLVAKPILILSHYPYTDCEKDICSRIISVAKHGEKPIVVYGAEDYISMSDLFHISNEQEQIVSVNNPFIKNAIHFSTANYEKEVLNAIKKIQPEAIILLFKPQNYILVRRLMEEHKRTVVFCDSIGARELHNPFFWGLEHQNELDFAFCELYTDPKGRVRGDFQIQE